MLPSLAPRLTLVLGSALLASSGSASAAADYPARDAAYHSYPEMVTHIRSVARAHPDIVRVFSIGKSHQGRNLWAAEISDNVGRDEGEPEVLFDGLHHAREHLSAEMAISVLDLLAGEYGKSSRLGRRVTGLVDRRRTWVVFMVDPDGLQYDLGGKPYRAWRRNRQPVPGTKRIGTDLNRNYGYRFGCCGGSSGKPGAWDYRGPHAWSAPETRAMRDFIKSRVVGGRQRIRTHITFHTAGELVLWPYGYTSARLPRDMTALDARTFRAMGRAMAATNGYRARQSSALYPSDGDMIDWTYGRQRIFSFTFELYPRGGSAPGRYYPPDERIARETRRNREAVLYLMNKARCPYSVLGARSTRLNCGPFFDDLEVGRGWRVDARGTDTARDGAWKRGTPKKSKLQLAMAASGAAALVTGPRQGHDVDGGRTSVRSPLFEMPANGKASLQLRYWVGLSKNAGPRDGLRVHLVDPRGARLATLLKATGTNGTRKPAWKSLSRTLPARLAGRHLAIELEAVDVGARSIVEAGVDQVRVTLD